MQRIPDTPDKQVRSIKCDLKKKDAENSAWHITIADLTNDLDYINLVKEKMNNGIRNTVEFTEKKVNQDKDIPVAFKTHTIMPFPY